MVNKQVRPSFLKKRSKKLLQLGFGLSGEAEAGKDKSFLALVSKKNRSLTS
jgi:hypothetical protein